MDIIRSSASSPSARPRLPRGGTRQPKPSVFGQDLPRTSPIGAMTATQRASSSSLGKTFSSIGSAVSSGISSLDRDLRATVFRPRSPVRTSSPRRTPVVPTQPRSAGPQAVNPSARPNINRAADQYRRNARPAQFGTISESPMNKPGMLNIPRAGTRLAGMSAGSALPVPPGMKPDKPKRSKAAKQPKPTAPAKPVKPKAEKVDLPKPPKKVTPPKPKGGGEVTPPKPKGGGKVTITAAPPTPAPAAPAKAPKQPKAPKRTEPKVLGQRGSVSIIHEGGRNVRVAHAGGASFYVPYNPKKKGKINMEGVEKTLVELGEPSRSDIEERERKGPKKFVYKEERDKDKRDQMFGNIKDEGRRTRAFEKNEQQRRQSAYNQRQERLKTKYKGDVTLRRMSNLGGAGQLRISKNLGLRALGPIGAIGGLALGLSDPAEALGMTVDQAGGSGRWARSKMTPKQRREERQSIARYRARQESMNPLIAIARKQGRIP